MKSCIVKNKRPAMEGRENAKEITVQVLNSSKSQVKEAKHSEQFNQYLVNTCL